MMLRISVYFAWAFAMSARASVSWVVISVNCCSETSLPSAESRLFSFSFWTSRSAVEACCLRSEMRSWSQTLARRVAS